jgi:hypothetical protein
LVVASAALRCLLLAPLPPAAARVLAIALHEQGNKMYHYAHISASMTEHNMYEMCHKQ